MIYYTDGHSYFFLFSLQTRDSKFAPRISNPVPRKPETGQFSAHQTKYINRKNIIVCHAKKLE
ncbi:MAG: hypothetical protein KBG25_07200 [Paludibacteraceae bacterium]|nr:hypothetical protein [Paludibacteraceae bacterium]